MLSEINKERWLRREWLLYDIMKRKFEQLLTYCPLRQMACVWTVMVNNSTNINKMNNDLSSQNIELQKKTWTNCFYNNCHLFKIIYMSICGLKKVEHLFNVVKWNQSLCLGGKVFNATFNNISVISVSFIGGGNWSTRENHRSLTNFIPWAGFELTTLVVISTDCRGTCSYKSNYHTITIMVLPHKSRNVSYS